MAPYECVVHVMHVCKKLKNVEFEKFSIQQTMDMRMSILSDGGIESLRIFYKNREGIISPLINITDYM